MESRTSKGRILVVDDDPSLQTMVRELATKSGYEVVQAFDGVEGLARAAHDAPDVILLDIMMPKLDGRDVLRQLKADAATRPIPVIVFSARGDHTDRLVGLELGADDYVEKPFNVEMLLRKIEYRIWKRRGEQGPPPGAAR